MLPCEFCEELFPEEDLILHQVRDVILFFWVHCCSEISHDARFLACLPAICVTGLLWDLNI